MQKKSNGMNFQSNYCGGINYGKKTFHYNAEKKKSFFCYLSSDLY